MILTIVGKVDSRILAYPIARAMGLSGLTCLISDDGAYRRLYHGEGTQGSVNGIDISVGLIADSELLNSLNKSGVPYDNVVFVSSNFIPENSSGVIVCHGVDRSMLATEKSDEDEDDILIPNRVAKTSEVEKTKGKKKSKEAVESSDNTEEQEKQEVQEAQEGQEVQKAQDTQEAQEGQKAQEGQDEVDETSISEDGERALVSEAVDGTNSPTNKGTTRTEDIEPDRIVVHDDMPMAEIQISYSTEKAPKDVIAFKLKDSFMNYIYNCEERKRIEVFPDKNFNKTVAKIVAPLVNKTPDEMFALLERDETISGEKAKKKK